MNNIEKFKTIKAIAKLKTELSKQVLKNNAKSAIGLDGDFGIDDAMSLGKMIVRIFKTTQ